MKTIDVVAAIIERDGKILLAQRPLHADQSGMWEFAGGKVESGESQPEALFRELREELGIEAVVGPADIPLLEAFILLRDARPADLC